MSHHPSSDALGSQYKLDYKTMNFGDRRNFFGVRRTIGHYEYRNRWFSVHFEPRSCRARPGAQNNGSALIGLSRFASLGNWVCTRFHRSNASRVERAQIESDPNFKSSLTPIPKTDQQSPRSGAAPFARRAAPWDDPAIV